MHTDCLLSQVVIALLCFVVSHGLLVFDHTEQLMSQVMATLLASVAPNCDLFLLYLFDTHFHLHLLLLPV